MVYGGEMSGRIWATLKQLAGKDDVPYPKHNPLTKAGKEVMKDMEKTYGSEKKAKQVFYASINKNKKGSKNWHKRG